MLETVDGEVLLLEQGSLTESRLEQLVFPAAAEI